MKSYPNIESTRRHDFVRGQRVYWYVGYGYGVWHIERYTCGASKWVAKKQVKLTEKPVNYIYGRTLQEISDKLAAYAKAAAEVHRG